MTFLEYLDGKASLTEFEADLFGVGMGKGWKKRGAGVEITDEMLERVITHFANKQDNKTAKRAYLRATKAVRKKRMAGNPTKKFLYVMQNSYGDLKIGISIDPFKRARALTTGSGSTTNCLAYWDVETTAQEVESFLLKHFKNVRKEGEWFHPSSFTVDEIHALIPCAKRKVHDGVKENLTQGLTDTEEYEYLHIKHETEKALLFNILGYDIWVAKSCIRSMNRNQHTVKVRIGLISDKMKAIS